MRVVYSACLLGLLVAYASAYTAWDLSSLQCTANDVEIMGPGSIINEPCGCTANQFFDAKVNFVINSKSSGRFCFTLYLCDGQNTTLVLNEEVKRGTFVYTFNFPHYPCNSGTRCFGYRPPGSGIGLVFPKGTDCPTGTCCSTVLYDVNPPASCPITGKLVPSKCRYNEICIQSKAATLTCKSGCAGYCGAYDATLELCNEGLKKPLDFQILSNGNIIAQKIDLNDNCTTFTVPINAANLNFVGRVVDADGCYRDSPIPALPFTPPMDITLNPFVQHGCGLLGNFNVTTTSGTSPITYEYKVNGITVPSADGVYIFPHGLSHYFGTCYSVSVTATDFNGCTDSAGPLTISQCVTTIAGCAN